MNFSRIELRDLLIAWLALGFAFASRALFYSLPHFFVFLVVALIGVGSGFVVHELSHKFLAQRYGYQAEFRMWPLGLIIAIATALITGGRILFAAPGAVHISGYLRREEEGLIAISGPLSNLGLAALFYILGNLGFPQLVADFGFIINLWLAAFNLLPFPPLDGQKIFAWSIPVWVIIALVAWGLVVWKLFLPF